jgi:hypothetical protein
MTTAAEVRELLAAAASTVEGINCDPYYRQSPKSGDAMVRRAGTVYPPNSFGGVVTWQVLVVLPQDLRAAQMFLDDVIPLVAVAISPELDVTSVTPQQLAFADTLVPGAVIEGKREEE